MVLSKIIVNMGFSYLAKVENEENNDEEDMFYIYIYNDHVIYFLK